MEIYVSNSLFMISEGFIGFIGQIQIKPAQSPIMSAYQDVISLRMHGNTRIDLSPTHQFFTHCLQLFIIYLLLKIVNVSVFLSHQKYEWFFIVEFDLLNISLALLEQLLTFSFIHGMDVDLFISLFSPASQTTEIVSLLMPGYLIYIVILTIYLDSNSLLVFD